MKRPPFVGCASDGQMGPLPAPRRARNVPLLPAADAARLAYYATSEVGALGPRGWRCFGTYGSNGSNLFVTPERHGQDLIVGRRPLAGPAVELIGIEGGTSGRFEVANAAADLFPVAKSFVDQVAAKGIGPVNPEKVTPADRITSRSATRVEFITTAGRQGLGTNGLMRPSNAAIRGAYILEPDDDMSMTIIRVRLPGADARLAPIIIRQVERRVGHAEH